MEITNAQEQKRKAEKAIAEILWALKDETGVSQVECTVSNSLHLTISSRSPEPYVSISLIL